MRSAEGEEDGRDAATSNTSYCLLYIDTTRLFQATGMTRFLSICIDPFHYTYVSIVAFFDVWTFHQRGSAPLFDRLNLLKVDRVGQRR
jgi:hypothetical protein